MMTGSVIVGSAVAGLMVCTPLPGMLKQSVSNPALAFASRIACRSEPAPLSFVLVTAQVATAGTTVKTTELILTCHCRPAGSVGRLSVSNAPAAGPDRIVKLHPIFG